MKLSPDEVATLVQKAFCLEVLADKKDCTSRYVDLPGKPLEDFIIAAINVGPVFGKLASDFLADKAGIFSYQTEALKVSNNHKSGKYINFGLLEIMSPTVIARLSSNDPKKVVAQIIEVMKAGNKTDVKHMIAARHLGWGSSVKRETKLAELTNEVIKATSPYNFYETIARSNVPNSSAQQWSSHYLAGQPWLKAQFDYLQTHDEPLLERIKNAFEPVRAAIPDIKIGILADMSAAAIFLHLSFK
jgi:hypothetical protein